MDAFVMKDITMSNYRKFEGKTFHLNPKMNVFIGKNAAGKTAVLEAINVMLGAYLAAYKEYVSSNYGFNISDSDVMLKTNEAEEGVVVSPTIKQFPCSVECHLLWDDKLISYQRRLEKDGGRTKFTGSNPMQPDVTKWEKCIKQADGSDKELIFPLVLYLSSARLWNENRSGKPMNSIPSRTDAYQRCLDRKRSSQNAFEYVQLLANVALEENNGKPYDAYKIIMGAVKYALREELDEGQEIVYSSRFGEFALKNPDGTVIQFSALSDGYRNVIKIVTDIATRMCILNPYLGGETLNRTPGIVIIDELDLSLHPTWQKRIVRILKNLFPKVQFMCATHSPFIIQSLEEGELIALDSQIEDEYSGQSIEDIAEEIMGVEISQYSEKKQKMYEAAKRYFEALKGAGSMNELQELKAEMDRLASRFSDNPAYCALLEQKYLVKKAEIEG